MFTYDPATPPAVPRGDQTYYVQTTSYSVMVAGHQFTGNDWFVFMSNDAGGGDFITFSAGSEPAGYGTIAIDGIPQLDAGFIVYLIDTTANLWNSVALPDNPFPALSAFDQRDSTLFSDNHLGGQAEIFHVALTELQQLPEPGVFGLSAVGLFVLAVWLRESKARFAPLARKGMEVVGHARVETSKSPE
jgi:hypothetical protein